jgi:HNH endonuclease
VRTYYRKFPVDVALLITRRATDSSGRVHCEACGIWLKSRRDWQIDHVISEGVRPAADKKRRLVAADGQLLCLACHAAKTSARSRGPSAARRPSPCAPPASPP